ncbi:MAG: thioredoxin family protein [bacterium]
MTRLIIVAFTLLLSLNTIAQHNNQNKGLVWHTDLKQANDVSTAEKKPIFAFFTGSDWCGWCKKLQRDVFVKPAFIAWANKNVVLLELDFPRRKQLSPAQVKQNAELQQAFRVTAYPTIWLFTMAKDSVGEKYTITAKGKCGYPRGATPGKEEEKFISTANAILANKK